LGRAGELEEGELEEGELERILVPTLQRGNVFVRVTAT
jgi:hypothetical protein